MSVAQPGAMHCPYCGYTGATPPAVANELSRAAAALGGMALEQRQLSQAQRHALSKGGCASALYVTFCVFLALPFLIWAIAAVSVSEPTRQGVFVAFGIGVLPAALLLLSAALGLGSIRRARRGLEQTCAAEVPATPGQALRCHVCGAELERSSAAVVRCAFCGADNMVSASALEQGRASQQRIVRGYEQAIAARSFALSKTSGRAWGGLFLGALLAPVGALVITFVGYFVLSTFVKLPPDTSVRYVAVVHGGRCCIARLSHDRAGHPVSTFGDATPKGFARVARARVKDALKPSQLVGQTVLDSDGKPAHISGLYQTPVDNGNQLSLDSPVDQAAVGSCLPPGKKL